MSEKIFQVLTHDEFGMCVLQQWFTDKAKAEAEAKSFTEMFGDEFFVEEGTDYITDKCRGCESVYSTQRSCAYGTFTGHWCEDCYNSSKYPYRKDRYDYEGNGERLDDDY